MVTFSFFNIMNQLFSIYYYITSILFFMFSRKKYCIVTFFIRNFSNFRLSMFRKKVELLLIKKVILTKKIFYEKLWDLKSGIYFYIRNVNPIPETVPSKKLSRPVIKKEFFSHWSTIRMNGLRSRLCQKRIETKSSIKPYLLKI